VLLTLDTTRPDRLGAYGHAAARTPHLDRLAGEGVRFARAYGVAPLTTPAHASMLTGLYPPRHGIHSNGDAALADGFTTLAERARAAGWQTGASVAAFVTTRVWGLDQGFDHYADTIEATSAGRGERWGRERRADAVVDDAIAWLQAREGDAPFVLWVHLYDPHDPYDPPEPWASTVPDAYDGELAFVDAEVGRLRTAVEAAAGPGGAAWIVAGDHGEALDGEHGERTHGTWVYDPTMRIPLFFRGPAPSAGRVDAATTVSNVDVMPTALGLLGLPVPDDLDGVDLSAALHGPTPDRPPVYMESETPWRRFGFHPELAAAEGPHKLLATPSPRLFDVDADPAEARDLGADLPDVGARLRDAVDAAQAGRIDPAGLAAGPELTARLAALGYVAGPGEGGSSFDGLPDAKDQEAFIARVEAARGLAADPAAATRAWRAILAEQPGLGEARLALATLLLRTGQPAEAEAVLREGVGLRPDSTLLRAHLAEVVGARGRPAEALALLEAVQAQVPGDDLARVGILRALVALDRGEEARTRGLAWLHADPDRRALQAAVGALQVQAGEVAAGEALLRRSLEDGVARQGVHRALGLVAVARDDLDDVIHHLTLESEAWPGDPRTRWELGNALMKRQRWDDAAAEYAALVRVQPADTRARRAWAQATFNAGDYAGAAEILGPALAAAPGDPQVLLLHANILDKQGDPAGARAAFERARAAAGR
jgi:arylsulfatase A-like enzyme/predicted Zn-dependent protease